MHSLTFPRHEEASTGVGQPSTNRYQEGRGDGGEDISLVTNDYFDLWHPRCVSNHSI
jgi:hypothetical protein